MAELTSGQSAAKLVAGVDGCRSGWVVVVYPQGRPDQAELLHFSSFAEILQLDPPPSAIAIDIPIGLPERTGRGGRDADIKARAVLGARQSAVFAVPSRASVMCLDYSEACRIALATSEPPRKISKQAFNIFPKIREVDALMSPALQERVFEVHPEVAFWAMNACKPLLTAKKIKSRPNPEGLVQRRNLLVNAGFDRRFLEAKHLPVSMAGPDDVLDAVANSWTAARILAGNAIRFPATPERDAKGLRIEIWG